MRDYYKLCNLFIFSLYLLIIYSFAKEVHNKFLLTDNLDNIDNIECILQDKYPTSKRDILYFNDKYLFIRLTDNKIIDTETKKPKENIHIIKLETLFNN